MLPLLLQYSRSLLPSLNTRHVSIVGRHIYGRPIVGRHILQKSFLATSTHNSKAVSKAVSKAAAASKESQKVSLKERTKTSAKQRAVQKFATPEQRFSFHISQLKLILPFPFLYFLFLSYQERKRISLRSSPSPSPSPPPPNKNPAKLQPHNRETSTSNVKQQNELHNTIQKIPSYITSKFVTYFSSGEKQSEAINVKKSEISEEVERLKILVKELKGKVEEGERKERERNERNKWWRIW
mmetsp:Transcript_18554/g.34416  ORF Transcript_18554/g.34416 Transcript_18554/m.34416 type:complete len:240 (-) Transcript_18554:59-778(-)